MSNMTVRLPFLRRFVAAGAVTATLMTGALVTAAPAEAASARNGVCDNGEFCYSYNSGFTGSVSDFSGSVSDLGSKQPSCYDFKSKAKGQHVCVKNHAAAVWNRTKKPVTVYFNSGYHGAHQTIAAGKKVNLVKSLKNNNAGHRFGGSTSTPSRSRDLSDALYTGGGGDITCLFDGYTTRPDSRHEGIDIRKKLGSGVRALVSGKITYVREGYDGGGLSTIAIYNSSLNKTVIYLHSNPNNSLRVGQSISRGQLIAVESYRGIGASSAHHTHVEMRLGRQTHASISLHDRRLDNPNPYKFWRSQGYNIH